jgi:hypothetical protein
VSSINDLMYIGGDQAELYFSWQNLMTDIEGVTCQMFFEKPDRQGRCYFDEEKYTCYSLWSQMSDFTIQIDNITYKIPPRSQTIETKAKKCQPGMFFNEPQVVSLIG